MDRRRHFFTAIDASAVRVRSAQSASRRLGLSALAMAMSMATAAMMLILAAVPARAQDVVMSHIFKNSSESDIRITRVFDGNCPRGFEPYQVTIRNQTAKPLQFEIEVNSNANYSGGSSFRSKFYLRADPNSESVHQLLVPVAPIAQRGAYHYVNGTIHAAATGLGSTTVNFGGGRSRDWPSIGISTALANGNLADLTKAYQASGSGSAGYSNVEFAMRFDPGMLPGDWRGYSGLDALMISAKEWRSLAPDARQAILEWVRLGGKLALYIDSKEKLESLGIAAGPRSMGTIERHQWKDAKGSNTLIAQTTFDAFKDIRPQILNTTEDYRSNWELQKRFPEKDFNTALIIVLLIVFGVVVGPVNLFVFAKSGKRHRLFITTPLISIIASVLIAVLILFSDGLGGVGTRILLVNLEPDTAEKKAYLVQEQFSRSGVLLGSSFSLQDAAVPTSVELKASRWNRGAGGNLKLTGNNFSGDWFLSRSEQAHLLEAVRPTRSRVELRRKANPNPFAGDDAAPLLFSSVDFELESLHYIDEEGGTWKAADQSIAAGESIELTSVPTGQFKSWWRKNTEIFSDSVRKELRSMPNRPAQRSAFYALSKDPKVGFIETADGIRWKDDRAVVYGTVLAAPGADISPSPRPAEQE